MKKLSKILATISTVTLLSCVWGVTTHAKVKKNGLGVPTHIEADNESEFLDDLKEVLKHITLKIVTESAESRHEVLATYRQQLGPISAIYKLIPYDDVAKNVYKFALANNRMTYSIATSYLYTLLRGSKLRGKEITEVWDLLIAYTFDETKPVVPDEIVFRLPEKSEEYYTCNMRWYLYPNGSKIAKPKPLRCSFKDEFVWWPPKTTMSLIARRANQTIDCPERNVSCSAENLAKITNSDISKILSLSTADDKDIATADELTFEKFLDSSQLETDFIRYCYAETIYYGLKNAGFINNWSSDKPGI